MKGFVFGFVLGVSVPVMAVTHYSDIAPLVRAVEDIYARLEVLELKNGIESPQQKPATLR